MENHPDIRILELLENIEHHFAFLFRRGFHITSVIFVDQNYEDWQVTMETDECIIKIYSYMGRVDLALSIPQLYHVMGLFELGDLICGISGNEDFFPPVQEPPMDEEPNLLRIARLLETYIDDILEKIGRMLALLSLDDPPAPSSTLGQMFQYN